MKTAIIWSVAAVVLSASSAPAQQTALYSFLSEDAKTLAYSPCLEEESVECVSHVLDCRADAGFGDAMVLTFLGGTLEGAPDTRKLATGLISKPYGEAKLAFVVDGRRIEAVTHTLIVSNNEMNVDLDLAMHFYRGEGFLHALTKANASNVKVDLEGYDLILSADAATGEKLLQLKAACDE